MVAAIIAATVCSKLGISKVPLYTVIRYSAPWILVIVFVLLMVTYVPQIALSLPNLLYR